MFCNPNRFSPELAILFASLREDSITDEDTEGEDAGILMAPNGLQQEGKAPDQHRVQNGRNPKKQPAPLAESLSSGSIDKDEGSELHPTSSSPGTLEDSESGPPPPRRGHTLGQRLIQPARKSSRASALEARGRIREQQNPLSSSMEEEEEEGEQEQSGSEGSSAASSDQDDEAGDIEGSSEDEASQNEEDGFGRPRYAYAHRCRAYTHQCLGMMQRARQTLVVQSASTYATFMLHSHAGTDSTEGTMLSLHEAATNMSTFHAHTGMPLSPFPFSHAPMQAFSC